MISDRYYMRDPNPAKGLAPLLWLIGALVGCFILQRVVEWAAPGWTYDWVALTADSIRHGRVWTLLTYSFLHEPNNLLHLIFNALGILFIGRLLLPTVGTRRFLLTYFGAALAGGIFWLAVNFTSPSRPVLLGASAGTYGLLALFCCRFAFDRMTVLLFFVIPVTIVPRYFLIVIGAIETIFFLFAELFPVGAPSTFAHSAHVAGLLAGIIAYRAMAAATPLRTKNRRRGPRSNCPPGAARRRPPPRPPRSRSTSPDGRTSRPRSIASSTRSTPAGSGPSPPRRSARSTRRGT